MTMNPINTFVYTYIRFIEMIGVLMRIFSFSLVSWLGPESPFMFVWAFNTTDAVILSWCSILKKDNAYTLLNVFWIMVGIVGMVRACHCSIIDVTALVNRFLTQIAALFS
jgi:hypothetical protein